MAENKMQDYLDHLERYPHLKQLREAILLLQAHLRAEKERRDVKLLVVSEVTAALAWYLFDPSS